MTQQEAAEAVEWAASRRVLAQAIADTKQDICSECRDRRCREGRICREFLRRVKSYAWQILARQAELN